MRLPQFVGALSGYCPKRGLSLKEVGPSNSNNWCIYLNVGVMFNVRTIGYSCFDCLRVIKDNARFPYLGFLVSYSEQYSLTIEGLTFERDDVPLFSALDAEFIGGNVVQIVGPNGAGKTTLLKLISGMLSPTSGVLSWCGQSLNASYFLSSLLMLGHKPGIKATLTPLENLRWYFGLNGQLNGGGHNHEQLFVDALHKVGLAGYEETLCQNISAGQQRRAALARLYLSEAPIWLLDEPFTAIDPAGVANLENLVQEHGERGGIVLLTSHQVVSVNGLKTLNLSDFQGAA